MWPFKLKSEPDHRRELDMRNHHSRLQGAIMLGAWDLALIEVEALEAIEGVWPGIAEFVRQKNRALP